MPVSHDPAHRADGAAAEDAVPEDVLRARAYLSAVTAGPAPRVAELITRDGPVNAAARIHTGAISAEVALDVHPNRRPWWGAPVLEQAYRCGLRLLTPEHTAEWPATQVQGLDRAAPGTDGADHRPLALWVRGSRRVDELVGEAITITGTRVATHYGEHLAAEIALALGSVGFAPLHRRRRRH